MNISFKSDYALKVILDLAQRYPKELVHIEDIARRKDIPQNYLEQILIMLKQGGFVQSKKGPNGGYVLARAPEKISLGEVLRFMEGSLYPISCVDPKAKQTCKEAGHCSFFEIWQQIGDTINGVVDNIYFDKLKDRDAELKGQRVAEYHI